jgi:hypothetical protein
MRVWVRLEPVRPSEIAALMSASLGPSEKEFDILFENQVSPATRITRIAE